LAGAALDGLVKAMESLQAAPQDVAQARAQVLQSMQAQLRNPEALSLALTGSVAQGDWRLLFAHRDWAAVQLLGGRAGTALWKRVREQEGLSYGVGSSLSVPASPRAEGNAGAINITASFAPENRDRLRSAIHDELQQRARNGFSSLEVGFARRVIVSSRADWLAQPANLAGLLANNLRWGRDMAWYARQTQAYENLDTQAVNAALAKYLDLDRLTEVAAGSFR